MKLRDRLQTIAGWKKERFVYEGPEPACDPFGVKLLNDVNASLGIAAMLEELLMMKTRFSSADRVLILADFTTVVLNDLRRGGTTPGEMLEAELFTIGPCDVVVVVKHDAVPVRSDSDAEDGTARHVGYDEAGRCCLLHFTNGPRG